MTERALYGCSNVEAYSLQHKLGEGTFGEVYKGVFKETGTEVALKAILLHNKDDGMPITALREIRILKSLKHENVIELLDMAVKRGSRAQKKRAVFYMITPYMDHDLSGLLQNSDVRFTLPHIKCYLSQLLEGVNYLHQQNFMHRDLKAANILIDNQGLVRLADFGLARKYVEAPPTLTSTSPASRRYTATVVTRWYRAPELLLGDTYYTPAIDMWGVGCVLGEIFKRTPIFPGKNDADQVHTIFTVLGSPTAETMPGFESLPNSSTLSGAHYTRTFDHVFSNVPPLARNLLANLLNANPLARLTALGALAHEFFHTGPPACPREDLPKYESSHELDAHKRKDATRRQEHSPPQRYDEERKHKDWRSGGGPRRRALWFKVHNKPVLKGIELVPPYRRKEYAAQPAEAQESQPQPQPALNDRLVAKGPTQLDY